MAPLPLPAEENVGKVLDVSVPCAKTAASSSRSGRDWCNAEMDIRTFIGHHSHAHSFAAFTFSFTFALSFSFTYFAQK